MSIPTIDFETRSEVDIKVGAYRYAEDPSTEVLSFAYNLTGDELDSTLWVPGMAPPQDLIGYIEQGGLIEAHHSFFEHCVWYFILYKRWGWVEMPLDQWRCSMAKCRANGIPGGLDAAGLALGVNTQKDKRGKMLIQKLCKPQRITKNNKEKWNNDPVLLRGLYSYNITDIDTEMEISEALPEMVPEEIDIWLLDQKINWRGIYIDRPAVEATLKVMEQAVAKYQAQLVEISDGAFATGGQRAKIMDWCEKQGFPLPGFTKGDVTKALAKPNIPDKVKRVLEIRQVLGKTSTAKYQRMMDKMGSDGRVHEVLVYHKAHTGRWGGAGVQVQNLPRPTIKADPEDMVSALSTGDLDDVEFEFDNAFELASSAIRSMIIPEPGKKFISADYSAIEARVLFWLAEDEPAMDIFRRGECIYCDMAADIYKRPYKEIFKLYKSEDFEATNQRKMGKDSVLGLGYQMGAPKFVDMCLINSNTVISKEFSQNVVKAYRTKFKSVTELWHGLERAAVKAMQNPGVVFKYKKIKYKFDGKYFLLCKLPSGRYLRYPGAYLKNKPTAWGEDKLTIHYKTYADGRWQDTTTYGGKLTENVDQAVSRDIMRDALLRLEASNYPVVMSVHDESVSEVDKDFGTIQEYCDIMCDLPSWAAGLPVKAEGWEGQRYRK